MNSSEDFVQTQMALNPDQRAQTDEELKTLTKKSQEISKWLKEKTKKQSNTAKNVDPVLIVSDLESKKSELNDQILLLKMKKMPIKVKEPEIKDAESEIVETPDKTEHTEDVKADESAETSNPNSDHLAEDLVEERFEL